MNAIKEIKESKKSTDRQITHASLMLLIGLLGLAIGTYMILGLGIFMLVMALTTQGKSIIKIFNDHFEMKLGPIAPTKYIRFSDIQELKTESPKKILLVYKDDGKEKSFRLPVHMMTEEDITYFSSLIKQYANIPETENQIMKPEQNQA